VIKDYRVRPGDPATDWFRLVFKLNDVVVHVFEFLSEGTLAKYAYTLLVESEPVLRYDNAPTIGGYPPSRTIGTLGVRLGPLRAPQ